MFNSILFADDTSLFHTAKNPNNIVKEINYEIPNIISWLNANKVSLNLEKTNFILFSPKNVPKLNSDLLINHTKITEVNETVYTTSDTVPGCCIKIKDQEHVLIKFKNHNVILLMYFINPPALVTRWDPQLRTAGVLHRVAA